MDTVVIFLLVVIAIVAICIVALFFIAIGFSWNCSSSDGIGYLIRLGFRPKISNKDQHKLLYEILDLVMKYTSDVNIWAIDGTLLGFIREDKIICYDYDLDFEILEDEWECLRDRLDRLIYDNPEYGYIWYDRADGKFAQIYHRSTMTMCDFQIAKIKKDKLDNKFLIDDIFPLKTKEIKNVYNNKKYTINIPNNAHNILVATYGKDYMTPDHVCDDNCENCVKKD